MGETNKKTKRCEILLEVMPEIRFDGLCKEMITRINLIFQIMEDNPRKNPKKCETLSNNVEKNRSSTLSKME